MVELLESVRGDRRLAKTLFKRWLSGISCGKHFLRDNEAASVRLAFDVEPTN